MLPTNDVSTLTIFSVFLQVDEALKYRPETIGIMLWLTLTKISGTAHRSLEPAKVCVPVAMQGSTPQHHRKDTNGLVLLAFVVFRLSFVVCFEGRCNLNINVHIWWNWSLCSTNTLYMMFYRSCRTCTILCTIQLVMATIFYVIPVWNHM